MINQLPLIVSLLLVLCIANPNTEPKFKIDPTRCSKDMACFVKEKCVIASTGRSDSKLVSFAGTDDKLDNKKCDVFIQIKEYESSKWLVLMQLTDLAAEENEIKIEHGGSMQIGCKSDDTFLGNIVEFDFTKKGDWEFKDGSSFCSFTLMGKTEAIASIIFRNEAILKTLKPKLIFSSTLEYSAKGKGFWSEPEQAASRFCAAITTLDPTVPNPSNFYALSAVDIFKIEFECPNSKKLLVKDGPTEVEAEKVNCDILNKRWHFVSPNPTTAADPEEGSTLEISCIEKKFCADCDSLKLRTCDGAQCKKFDDEAIDAKGCKSHKCTATEEWWTVDGVANEHSPSGVQCKKDDVGGSSWFLIDANTPKKIDNSVGIACRNTKSCKETDLTYKCPEGGCPDGQSEPSVNVQDGIVNCTTGKLYDASDSLVHPYPSCKTEDGTWQGLGTGRHYCQVKEDASADKQEAPSTGNAALYAGLGVLVVLLVVGLLVVIFFVMTGKKEKIMFWKKKKATSRKGGKSSKKSTKSTKSKESKSSTKKPSDSDPPEKASGKEGEAPKDGKPAETPATPTTDIEKLQTDPNPSNPPSPGRGGAEPGAPGGPPKDAPPPKDGAAPPSKDGAAPPPKDGAAPPAKAAPPGDKPLDNKTTNPIAV